MEELPDVALDVDHVGRVWTRNCRDRRKINAVDLRSGIPLSKVAGHDAGTAADVKNCLRGLDGDVEGFVVHQLGKTERLVLKASVLNGAGEALNRIGMKKKWCLLIGKGVLCLCGMIGWLTASCVGRVIAANGSETLAAWIGWGLAFDMMRLIACAELVS